MLSLSMRVVRHVRQLRTGAGPAPTSSPGGRSALARRGPRAPLRSRLAVEQPDGGLPVRHTELAQDGRDVAAHGGRRDEQARRDLGGSGTLAHELEHVPLAPGEPGRLAVGNGDPPVLPITEFVHEAGDQRPWKRRLPRQDPLQRIADGGLVQTLEQIAGGAGAQGVEEVLVLRETVSMTMEVSGRALLIWVAAAMPLPGMLMSSRQTSGRSRLAPSTAAAASAASAQTRKSPVRSSALRTRARVRA